MKAVLVFCEGRHDIVLATDKVSNRQGERLKAIITVTGQFDHPGDPMSIIIGRGGLPRAQFEGSELSAQLAAFLVATPWSNEGASIGCISPCRYHGIAQPR